MTTTSDAIRKLLLAHVGDDEVAFRSAAFELIDNERRVNRVTFANELERILSPSGSPLGRREALNGARSHNGTPPRDKDRNAQLVELADPARDVDDLVLNAEVRSGLERIVNEWRKADILRAHGLRPAGKLLFYGPPGVGKTVAAECIAKALYLPLATVRFDAVVSSYLGETAANLRCVFEFARTRPMVLLFDEFDAIGKQRGSVEEHGELKRVVNSFLQLLDSFHSETVTVAATNYEGLLDPALWRRFDAVIAFPLPGPAEIEAVLCRQLRQVTVAKNVRLSELAKRLTGFSHADVERVAVEAIKDTILAGQDRVEADRLQSAVERLRNRRPSLQATPAPSHRGLRRRKKSD